MVVSGTCGFQRYSVGAVRSGQALLSRDVLMSGEPEGGPAPLSVQQAYEQMMREQVAPELRELGFRGTARIFTYSSGGQIGKHLGRRHAVTSGR
jgi:hypothetical protein